MRFAFFPGSCLPFQARSLEERPLGGTETGIIRLSEALSQRGHEVTVFSDHPNPPLSSPLYAPHRSLQFLGEVDALISVRDWKSLLLPIKARSRVFWTGDAFDQLHSVGIGDRRVARSIDAFLAVSDWHADTMCQRSGFPREKTAVIRNGVHLEYFKGSEIRHRKRLAYSSTPYRGARYLPEIFREVRKKHPDAELHIFSGYDVYSAGNRGYDERAEQEWRKLADVLREIPGCFVRGNMKQADLARELMKCSILAYPNTFAETSCITAMEAQAAGCVVVSSKLGALPETVGDAGVLIEGSPEKLSYIASFIESIDRLLSDDAEWKRRSDLALAQRGECGWDKVAERVLSLFSN